MKTDKKIEEIIHKILSKGNRQINNDLNSEGDVIIFSHSMVEELKTKVQKAVEDTFKVDTPKSATEMNIYKGLHPSIEAKEMKAYMDKSPYDILRPVDFIQFGAYVMLGLVFTIHAERYLAIMFFFTGLHYFPLIYLLRKHGYWSDKGLGLDTTDKGDKLFSAIYLEPFSKALGKLKNSKYYPILRLLSRLLLLVLILYPLIVIITNVPVLDSFVKLYR